jgi:hypothetical protein
MAERKAKLIAAAKKKAQRKISKVEKEKKLLQELKKKYEQ